MPSPVSRVLHWLQTKVQDLLFPLRMHLGRKIMFDSNRQIVQVSSTELIKGPCSEQELEAMTYVTKHSAVPLSRVRRIYRRRRGLYIAMDFVEGERLDELWSDLDGEQRRKVVEEVCRLVGMLHSVPVPPELGLVVASCEGGKVNDGIFGFEALGPFADLEAFYEVLRGHPNLVAYRPIWDSPAATKSPCVLSHADIAPRNIIRRREDGALVLIDWEFAGWWPRYWDRVKWSFSDFPVVEGWVGMLDEGMIIQPE